ncbi:MAG: hypothetical protein NZ772_16515 [Cyanobacteria bacterium]|nr:hypothetical protein [Cyanobacteriota bacterium]
MKQQAGQWLWLLSWGAILLLTNRWISWQASITDLSAQDVLSYAQIAEAAPALPTIAIGFQYAQRLISPYVVGTLASLTHWPLPLCFRIITYSCLGAIVLVMQHLLQRFRLTPADYRFCLGLLILNPYLLRYYLLVPGMLPDVVFVLGTAVILWGLVAVQGTIVVAGLALGAIGRQTALLVIPGLLLWIWKSAEWQSQSWPARLRITVAIVLTPSLIYLLTAQLAHQFALPSINTVILTRLLTWMASPEFSWLLLGDHCLRLVMPMLAIASLLLGVAVARSTSPLSTQSQTLAIIACLLMTVGVIAQPFIAGPAITGQNATRLAALGLLPMITALALALQHYHLLTTATPPLRHILLGVGVVIGSLHHLYTTPALPNAASFAAVQITLALLFATSIRLIRRSTRAS